MGLLMSGCVSRTPLPQAPFISDQSANITDTRIQLGIGDLLFVSFLASPHLSELPYLIAVGDILRIDIVDHPELTRERIAVLPDGYISLPMVGRVEAADMAIDALAEILVDQYINGNIINPQVVVSVEETQDPLEPLLNLVNRGDQHEPLQFIIGLTSHLDLPFIDPVPVQSNLDELQSQIKARYLEMFGPRLHVMVQLQKATQPVVYVIGEVMRPGPVTYSTPNNPLMAIAAAGGFMPSAETEDIRLFRWREDNSFDSWSINLASRLNHGQPGGDQVQLVPLDVIYVPRSGIAEANRVVEQYIRNMLPIQLGVGGTYQVNDTGN